MTADIFHQAAKTACVTAIDKRGMDVLLFDLKAFPTITDYAVVVTGRSGAHAKGLSSAIQDALAELPIRKRGVETDPKGLWILLDYYGLTVHIFDQEERRYYNLERLWKEAKTESFEGDGEPSQEGLDLALKVAGHTSNEVYPDREITYGGIRRTEI